MFSITTSASEWDNMMYHWYYPFTNNVLFAVLILYFVHGLAIIRAHLARWVGRGWLVRWGVTLICLQMPLPPLVIILGVTDSFRSMRPRADDDGGTS